MKFHIHKRNIYQTLKSVAVLILLLSVSSVGSVSAHRMHHYRSHVGRVIRRRGQKAKQRAHHTSKTQIKRNCNELYQQTIYDINKDRQQYHQRPLRLDRRLSKVGTIRSYQLQKYFSHNTPHQLNEAQYLLNHKHIHHQYYGENIASDPLGLIGIAAVGSYNTPTDAKNSVVNYNSRNGRQLANSINNASMYHDAGDNNGHRDNILSRNYKKFGVGVSYGNNPRNKDSYMDYLMAIEFIG